MRGHPSAEGPTFLVEKVNKGMDVGAGNSWLCRVCRVESLHGCHGMVQKSDWVGRSILGGCGSTWDLEGSRTCSHPSSLGIYWDELSGLLGTEISFSFLPLTFPGTQTEIPAEDISPACISSCLFHCQKVPFPSRNPCGEALGH